MTEIDSLIGEPAVWQEQMSAKGAGSEPTKEMSDPSHQTKGLEAGTQTDDVDIGVDPEAQKAAQVKGGTCIHD